MDITFTAAEQFPYTMDGIKFERSTIRATFIRQLVGGGGNKSATLPEAVRAPFWPDKWRRHRTFLMLHADCHGMVHEQIHFAILTKRFKLFIGERVKSSVKYPIKRLWNETVV